MLLEGEPRISDVVLVPSPYAHARGKPARPEIYFDGSLRIADDLWLAHFSGDFADSILTACSATGENFAPIRQYGAPYGFVRVCAPSAANRALQFDYDGRLLACVALSRLVHPTSIGFEYAARVRQWGNGPRQVIPFTPHDLNAYAFVMDLDQNWLIPSDAPKISEVVRLLAMRSGWRRRSAG